MESKYCRGCKRTRRPQSFYHSTRDGLSYRCRDCLKEERVKNKTALAAKSRNYARANPEKVAAAMKAWKKKNARKVSQDRQRIRKRLQGTEQGKAYSAIRNAVYSGKLVKPDHCEDCGKELPPEALHGHHHDYSDRLNVRWICVQCHGKEHRVYS